MKYDRRSFFGVSLMAGGALFAPRLHAALKDDPAITPPAMPQPVAAQEPRGVIPMAIAALDRHSAQIANRDRLGIADYTASSREMRFHIVDVEGGSIMQSLLVSHGRGSDPANSGFAQRFSNVPGSNASSRGSFLTGEEYLGKHGRSRRLHGLEEQNDQAFDRAIVIHGADYVDLAMAENQGRVGRSLGCFAFEQCEIGRVLELLGPGRLLYVAGSPD